MSKRTSFIIGFVLLAVLLLGVEWRKDRSFRLSELATITFLDVGQGDATLIRDGKGKTILIDAGPGDRILEALENHLPPWERDIDLLILTHLDADHISGASGLLRRYRIGEIWWNGAAATTTKSRRLLSEIHTYGVLIKVVQSGERYSFSRASFTVIHPDRNLSGVFLADKNAESVSLRLECGEDVALLAGDTPIESEMDFLEDGDVGDVTLLKVSHHGSKHSTSGKFLDGITPEYAVISSGKGNRYGHPASRVLIDLRKRGIKTFRTDESGDITFSCDSFTLRPL